METKPLLPSYLFIFLYITVLRVLPEISAISLTAAILLFLFFIIPPLLLLVPKYIVQRFVSGILAMVRHPVVSIARIATWVFLLYFTFVSKYETTTGYNKMLEIQSTQLEISLPLEATYRISPAVIKDALMIAADSYNLEDVPQELEVAGSQCSKRLVAYGYLIVVDLGLVWILKYFTKFENGVRDK